MLLVACHLQAAAAAAVTTGVDLVVNMCMRTVSSCAVESGHSLRPRPEQLQKKQ
jgi:hypothetical protein